MAIDVGQSAKAAASAVSRTTSAVTTTGSGSTFLIFVIYSGTFSSVSDNKSNTYTQIGTEQTVGSSGNSRVYYVENGTGGASHTATLTLTASNLGTIFFVEITGGATSGILDQFAVTQDTTSPYTSPGITTTQAAELLLGLFGDNASNSSTHTHGNSFTEVIAETNGASHWVGSVSKRIVAATGTYNTSVTESGDGSNHTPWITSWKEAAAGGGAMTVMKKSLRPRAFCPGLAR